MSGPIRLHGHARDKGHRSSNARICHMLLLLAFIMCSAFFGFVGFMRYQYQSQDMQAQDEATFDSDHAIKSSQHTAGMKRALRAGRIATRRVELEHDEPHLSQITRNAQPTTVSLTRSLDNPRAYHTITSCAGFANHWQARIHYYWFRKQRAACQQQAVCDMGGFTRLLHTGEADDLMDEIPTVVVDKLPKSAFAGLDDGYIVLNRPYAFNEWLKKASVPERYILMCESDHLIMRPMPNLMQGEKPASAMFSYMVADEYPEIVRSLVGDITDKELHAIPKIGNSPTFVSVRDFRQLAPQWYNTTMQIWNDKKAHTAWNWILEMYGFTLAIFRTGLYKDMLVTDNFMAQPPFDESEIGPDKQPFIILHLTYPMRYNATGHHVDMEDPAIWCFNKREYSDVPPPRNLPLPPPVVKGDMSRLAVAMINEATNSIPCWDTYVATKRVTLDCINSGLQ